MPQFIVTTRRIEEKLGTVLWEGEATNQEEAAVQAANNILSDGVIKEDFTSKGKVSMAQSIIEMADSKEGDRLFLVHRIAQHENGSPDFVEFERLDFESK